MIIMKHKVKFKEGELIKVAGGIFENQIGFVLEDSRPYATFLWVFVSKEPQWIHINDCEPVVE